MNYKIQHIPKSAKKRPQGKMAPTYITIHSTANLGSTAQNERNWLTNPTNDRTASWHICIDENEAVEAIPLNEIAYHTGTTEGNNKSIGIEMCESGNRQKVIDNTIQFVAKMLYDKGWGVDKLKRHYDWNNKNCPRILNYDNWQGWSNLKNDVELELLIRNKVVNTEVVEELIILKRFDIFDELPEWAKPTIKKLMDKGCLSGDENGNLDLSLDILRIFTINDRAGLYK